MLAEATRGDAGEESDVDLFFEHERGKLSLFTLMEVKERAAEILGAKTALRSRIETSALQVF